MENTINILAVEDQKLMRIGIQSLFTDYARLQIIAEAYPSEICCFV